MFDGLLQLSSSHSCEVRSDPLRWSTSSTSGGSPRGLGAMVPGLGFGSAVQQLLGLLDGGGGIVAVSRVKQ